MAKGKTKKVEVEVPEIFSDDLVALLHAWPHVKTVYLNEKGEHRLAPYPGFVAYDVSEVFEKNGELVVSLAGPDLPEAAYKDQPEESTTVGEKKEDILKPEENGGNAGK